MRILVILAVLVLVCYLAFGRGHRASHHVAFGHGQGAAASSANLQKALKNGEIVDADGHPIAAAAFPSRRYTFVYFSANWCPPCHRFTPSLVKFVADAGENPPFNVLMVDEDRSQDQLKEYATTAQMPWSFAELDGDLSAQLQHDYGADGIPDLVLIDANGAVVADSFDGHQYRGPQAVLDDYSKLSH